MATNSCWCVLQSLYSFTKSQKTSGQSYKPTSTRRYLSQLKSGLRREWVVGNDGRKANHVDWEGETKRLIASLFGKHAILNCVTGSVVVPHLCPPDIALIMNSQTRAVIVTLWCSLLTSSVLISTSHHDLVTLFARQALLDHVDTP